MFYAFCVTGATGSPWGPVHLAATARGVAAIELLSSSEGFAAGLARRGLVVSPADAGPQASSWLAAAMHAVDATLAGEAWGLDALAVDLEDRPAFDRRVLGVVRMVPRGSTISYGEVARQAGHPGAAQATGGAVGRNPVGLLIPCHRVIAADGSLGGYGAAAWGGREAALAVKAELLALEGVHIEAAPVSRTRHPGRRRSVLTRHA